MHGHDQMLIFPISYNAMLFPTRTRRICSGESGVLTQMGVSSHVVGVVASSGADRNMSLVFCSNTDSEEPRGGRLSLTLPQPRPLFAP